MLKRDGYHAVVADALPDDTKRILPLIGNDDLKLCVDARGVMHNQKHQWGSHPPARITWAGRRHNRRIDEYNSNLFEWGWVDLQLVGEDRLPPVTGWRQTLHPRKGYVETVIQRGDVEERTISFVHLEHNLIVFHRSYRHLPKGIQQVRATYTLCQNDVSKLPFHVTWQPQPADATGIEADTQADGVRLCRGRLALFADHDAKTRVDGDNRLVLEAPLAADGSVTVMLALCDDLSELEPHARIDFDGSMSPAVREVHRELQARRKATVTPAPAAAIAATRRFAAQGFESIFANHRQAWERWLAQVRVELPLEEEQLRAALDTQLYTIRVSATAWSFPPNPFNTSWGAGYFWDERFSAEALMHVGAWELPQRVAEFRRTILPYATRMSGWRGARYLISVTEPGTPMGDGHTITYENYSGTIYAHVLHTYCRYRDDEATWRRYYPVFREVAEFCRHYQMAELPGNNLMAVPLVDVDETVYPVQDGPFMVHGAARAFHLAIEVAQRLGLEEPELPEWRRLGALTLHLAHHIDELARTNTQRPDGAPANNPTGPFSDYELFLLPPPDLDVDPTIQRWRDEHRRSLDEAAKSKHKDSAAYQNTFWSWGSLSEAYRAATGGQAGEAMRHLRKSLTTMMDFGALNESAKPDLSHVNHPWFTTAAGGYLRSLTRMLMYPRDEHVYVLPGIPAGWRDFGFTLATHGQGEVTVNVQSGRLTELTLHEHKRIRRVLHLPKRFVSADQLVAEARVISQDDQQFTVEVEGVGDCRVLASK